MHIVNTIIEVGQLVRVKRRDMGLTQKELAALCHVGTRFISELENGKPSLEIDKVLKVIRNVGLNIALEERRVGA